MAGTSDWQRRGPVPWKIAAVRMWLLLLTGTNVGHRYADGDASAVSRRQVTAEADAQAAR